MLILSWGDEKFFWMWNRSWSLNTVIVFIKLAFATFKRKNKLHVSEFQGLCASKTLISAGGLWERWPSPRSPEAPMFSLPESESVTNSHPITKYVLREHFYISTTTKMKQWSWWMKKQHSKVRHFIECYTAYRVYLKCNIPMYSSFWLAVCPDSERWHVYLFFFIAPVFI